MNTKELRAAIHRLVTEAGWKLTVDEGDGRGVAYFASHPEKPMRALSVCVHEWQDDDDNDEEE